MARHTDKKGDFENYPRGRKKEDPENYPRGIKRGIKLGFLVFGVFTTVIIGSAVQTAVQSVKTKKIQQNAELDVPRSLKNIDQENMGEYLKNQIALLYEKYPDLDELMYKGSVAEEDLGYSKYRELINDIYLLYKAYMLDNVNKEIGDIDITNVTVSRITDDGYYDLITAEDEDGTVKTIARINKLQYESITNDFIDAKNGEINAVDLAKSMYELLAKELGLKEGVKTSEEIAKQMEEIGYYWDEETNTFYIKRRRSKKSSRRTRRTRGTRKRSRARK